MTNSSFYINLIEAKLKKLNVNVNDCVDYNNIFSLKEDASYTRALRVFNESLNKIVDDLNSMDALQIHNIRRSLMGKVIGD